MSVMQQQLFDNPLVPPKRESLSESRATRNESHENHKPKMHPQSVKVVAAIQAAGDAGLTRHECADLLGLPVSSVCGRVKPLLDSGLLYQKPGVRRDGRTVIFVRGE